MNKKTKVFEVKPEYQKVSKKRKITALLLLLKWVHKELDKLTK